jgi:hypothetical protein
VQGEAGALPATPRDAIARSRDMVGLASVFKGRAVDQNIPFCRIPTIHQLTYLS